MIRALALREAAQLFLRFPFALGFSFALTFLGLLNRLFKFHLLADGGLEGRQRDVTLNGVVRLLY